MNEHQQRALWAAALTELANAITSGRASLPATVRLWTHGLGLPELLEIADHTYITPMKIRTGGGSAWVDTNVGELLGIDVSWSSMARLPIDGETRARWMDAIDQHNRECVPVDDPIGVMVDESLKAGQETK